MLNVSKRKDFKLKYPNQHKKILVAPLNWGLGHATRMMPLIRESIHNGYEVEIATDGQAYNVLKEAFPELTIHTLPAYHIKYSKNRYLMLRLILQAPKMVQTMRKEHKWLKAYVQENKPDVIISDDRFGMYHSDVKSYYVTHQINVLMPSYLKFLQPLVRFLHRKIIQSYTACLIPDMENNGLSGELAHAKSGFRFPVKYMGVLSRFQGIDCPKPDVLPDVLAVISGPEPQRSLLEQLLIELYQDKETSVWIVSGKPESDDIQEINNVKLISHLPSEQLCALMKYTPVLISRSGYSTLMDLFELKRKAILIPTPGQTEQLYLGKLFAEQYGFTTIKQHDILSLNQIDVSQCGVWKTVQENAKDIIDLI